MITVDLGNRIRELRQKIGLSQEKFALKIGMDRTYFLLSKPASVMLQ